MAFYKHNGGKCAKGYKKEGSVCVGIMDIRTNMNNADGLPTETGIAPVDTVITKTLEFEQSKLGNPLVQFALLGLAGFGAYTLVTKFIIKK